MLGYLKDLNKKAKKTVSDVSQATQNFVQGTTEDIHDFVNTAVECTLSSHEILLKHHLRVLQYDIVLRRILIDSGTLPVEFIRQAFEIAQKKLRKKIKPVIYKLNNPHEAVWKDENKKELEEVAIPFSFPEQRTPYIFIHGAFNKQNKDTAFDFYKPFEKEVKMFEDPSFNMDKDVYIISYDTELTDEYEWAIRSAFERILGPITDPEPNPAPDLFAAVFWNELTSRAEETGEDLIPFFKGLSELVQTSEFPTAKIFTHSLGCHVFAHAAHSLIKEAPQMTEFFSEWYCMAAALPIGSLASGGQFGDANKVVLGSSENSGSCYGYGVSVWYSRLDSILSTAYFLATGTLAIGQTGALVTDSNRRNIWDFDVTDKVGLTHTITDEYFSKLGMGSIYRDRMTDHCR